MFCGDRIGAYEPIIVVGHGRETALSREPELRESRPALSHKHCAEVASNDVSGPT